MFQQRYLGQDGFRSNIIERTLPSRGFSLWHAINKKDKKFQSNRRMQKKKEKRPNHTESLTLFTILNSVMRLSIVS